MKKKNSKIAIIGKKIQARARQLKRENPNMKHIEAVKKASKQLKKEGKI